MIGAFGLVGFTSIATISNLLFWVGCAVSYKAALIGATVGFLGGARTLGASTMLTSVGAKRGIPQGQLSGDRANMVAILKVIGPLLYGALYVRGKAANLPYLPFVFNVGLSLAALALTPVALRGVGERPADGPSARAA